jgi:hypothetical protein
MVHIWELGLWKGPQPCLSSGKAKPRLSEAQRTEMMGVGRARLVPCFPPLPVVTFRLNQRPLSGKNWLGHYGLAEEGVEGLGQEKAATQQEGGWQSETVPKQKT